MTYSICACVSIRVEGGDWRNERGRLSFVSWASSDRRTTDNAVSFKH